MTPLQLYMLRQRYIEHLQYQEMLTGILAAATVNFSFCHPEKAVRPENFMLHPYELQEEPQKLPQKSQRVTAQTVLAAFKNFLPEDFSLEA